MIRLGLGGLMVKTKETRRLEALESIAQSLETLACAVYEDSLSVYQVKDEY